MTKENSVPELFQSTMLENEVKTIKSPIAPWLSAHLRSPSSQQWGSQALGPAAPGQDAFLLQCAETVTTMSQVRSLPKRRESTPVARIHPSDFSTPPSFFNFPGPSVTRTLAPPGFGILPPRSLSAQCWAPRAWTPSARHGSSPST